MRSASIRPDMSRFRRRDKDIIAPPRIWLPLMISITAGLFVLNTISESLAVWAAIALFLLGVPHGAIERTKKGPKFIMPTLAYTALYLVFGILVFSSWLISPLGTFVLFLLLSAWHFGEAEPDIKSVGLWVIIGSCLIYPSETLSIFGVLIDADGVSPTLETLMQYGAALTLFLIGLEYLWKCQKGVPMDPFRIIAIITLFVILPPILAVAIYFFAFHGMGEFIRTLSSVSRSKSELKPVDVLTLYGPATIPSMIGAVGIIILTYHGIIPLPISTGLAAAFIIPHMLPVEALLRVDRGES